MDRAHRIARKQETVTAVVHNGRGTPASGSGELVKNDVRNTEWSFEVKTTTRKTYSLALDTFETAETHALVDGRRPAMVIAFDRGIGKPPRRLVVIDESDFLELTGNYEQQHI
jgi:hypothetical protein